LNHPLNCRQALKLVDKFRSALDEFIHIQLGLWEGVSTVEVVEVTDGNPKNLRRRPFSIALERSVWAMLNALNDVACVAQEASNQARFVVVIHSQWFDLSTHSATTFLPLFEGSECLILNLEWFSDM
jgi:hypothetical protein